jgi:hypothetical protein
MLKEINWLGEANELDQTAIDKIAKLTDQNKHTSSVEMLAKVIGAKREVRITQLIGQIHKVEGHMSPNIISYRTEIMKRLLKVTDKMYSNAKDIHKAF